MLLLDKTSQFVVSFLSQMDDIDAMFTDMLQEMDLLTQVRWFFLKPFLYSVLHKDLICPEHCCVFSIKQVTIPLSTESELIHTWNCAFHASSPSNYRPMSCWMSSHCHLLQDFIIRRKRYKSRSKSYSEIIVIRCNSVIKRM